MCFELLPENQSQTSNHYKIIALEVSVVSQADVLSGRHAVIS